MSEHEQNTLDSTRQDAREMKQAAQTAHKAGQMSKKTAQSAQNLMNKKKKMDAVKKGAKGAKAAKDIAEGASVGGVAGAIIGALANKDIRNFLIGIVASLSIIIVAVLYALPTSGFEAAESFFGHLKTKWEESVYTSAGNIQLAKFSSAGKVVVEGIKELGDIREIAKSIANDPTDELSDSAQELLAAQFETAQKESIEKKLAVAKKKVNKRAQDIESALRHNEGDISGAIEKEVNKNGKYRNVSVNLNVDRYSLSRDGTFAVAGLYMVQDAASLNRIELTSFAKWLGWYGGKDAKEGPQKKPKKPAFTIAGVKVQVKPWYGTYLPQYLHEQRDQETHMLSGIAKGADLPMPPSRAKFMAPIKGGVKEHVVQPNELGTATDYNELMAPAVDSILTVDGTEKSDWNIREEVIRDEETGEVIAIDATVDVNLIVRPRDLPDIAKIMGLWQDDLGKDQGGMVSKLGDITMWSTSDDDGFGAISGDYSFVTGMGGLPVYRMMHNINVAFVGAPKQCTWYAADRMYQLYKDTNGEMGFDLTGYKMGNGGEWSRNALRYGFKVDKEAAVGKAMCFPPGRGYKNYPASPKYGHIAVVEEVHEDGSVRISEMWGDVANGEVKSSLITPHDAALCEYIDFTQRLKR